MTRIISLCLFIAALYCSYQGWFRYDFWENNSPGSGFIPVIAGVLLGIFSLNVFIKNEKASLALNKNHLYQVLGSFLLLGSVQVFGMIISIAAFMVVWLIVIEKFPLSRASIYGVATTTVIYIVFKVALSVPLPEGVFGI
ncbi:tripartite tricarboxylate transporter TctB family protein [Cytobacillus depressus]|uniref:Tripartite tricarboxylate transporter TctB family protein n=1 Tax=Cytobacillus depressus TaxID=1602942 RepID=A0A6L3V298_9BACI|nr:tripartite tricarboxylate transporter TctB family protein [Cytobacillus depressus]KAB2330469.1 tripartite tricarboxylate transporter TctB family protein [Cytobacillus depressus]